MNDDDLKKIGDEMVRTVEPIYEELGKIDKHLGGIEKRLGGAENKLEEVEDKVDSLMGEALKIHQEIGGINDKLTIHIEKENTRIERIEKFVGIPAKN